MAPLLIILIIIIVCATGITIMRVAPVLNEPKNNPKAFLKKAQRPDTLVVCVGNSLTHGVASANYVEVLQQQHGADGYGFVNAGINGNLAWNVLQRLDDIIACQPDMITLLIGTNDVNATFNQEWEDNYRKGQKIPEKPTLDWYCQNIEHILDRLKNETEAQIAVLELPMLGEDLNTEINQRIMTYNRALKTIAADKQVKLLPLHERLSSLLPSDHDPSPYEGKINMIPKAMMKHYILLQSWNHVAQSYGLYLLTDHIHLNNRGRDVIVELIHDFLVSRDSN